MPMEPSRESKGTHSDVKDDSEETRIVDLRSRFKKMHPADFRSDQSFALFLEEAKENLVCEYLDVLEEFLLTLPEDVTPTRDNFWQCFIDNGMSISKLTAKLSLTTDDMKNTAIKLAFLRNYPQLYAQTNTNTSTMLKVLEAESEEDVRAILEVGKRPVYNSRVSGGVIKKGYQSPFLKSKKVVDPILNTLNEYARDWKKTIYLGPYAALIGPSTSGKSRLIMEMSKHICVIYICLRPKDSTGYPPRSALADHMIRPASNDGTTYYTSLLAGIFQVVANFFSSQNPAQHMQDRLKEWNDYTEVASLGTLDMAERTQQKFTADVLEQMRKFAICKDATLQKTVTAMRDSTKFINTRSSMRVLLALDEASALLEIPDSDSATAYFRTLRRTIRNIPPRMGIFIILVDTTSHIANFSLESKFDSSARHNFKGQNLLYQPIFEISSFDAMVSSDPPRSWGELVSPERLFKYGSPIFGAYFRDAIAEQQQPQAIYDAILELAFYKLHGPIKTTQSARPEITKAQAFAFLGPTIQPQINNVFALGMELIASHAAHCDYISPGCELVFSNYPSQFTLAAAAVDHLQDDITLIQCIKALTTNVLHGLDAAGGAGELASRIILLRAIQTAMATSCEGGVITGRPVSLVNFLEALTGKKENELDLGLIGPEEKKDLLTNGMIFWNHFSRIKSSPTPNKLLRIMYRGMAAQCHPNQPGIDQIFTIYLKRESDSLDEKNISFCGIQVKNRKKDLNVEDENYKLTDTYAQVHLLQNNPYLILYMNLNSQQDSMSPLPDLITPNTPSQKDVTWTQGMRRASLSFNGLNQFGCLSQGVKQALEELINVEPDFAAIQRNEESKDYSHLINPEFD
ncbi:hypothetical protein PGT21_023275 [Puccinia graminis f. sp. tritici]|uniref:Uncharacterized protein n=1 Tax=Puccinia graminis f. sp. tritici TaxID=56615 RepID=A0A5B0M4L5_PUCGR|nr:hypothetical protein PGT21_023275 [Puccinia graminis f. sp. tritici]KAA1125718.1 hypothetical protein PGTUg99_005628 [Puccinia graminis f. sp. tritici]